MEIGPIDLGRAVPPTTGPETRGLTERLRAYPPPLGIDARSGGKAKQMSELTKFEHLVLEALRAQAKSTKAQEEHLARISKIAGFFYQIWWLSFLLGLGAVVLAIAASGS